MTEFFTTLLALSFVQGMMKLLYTELGQTCFEQQVLINLIPVKMD